MCLERDKLQNDDDKSVYMNSKPKMLKTMSILKQKEKENIFKKYAHDFKRAFSKDPAIMKLTYDG